MAEVTSNIQAAESMYNFLMGANILTMLYDKKIIKSATITPSYNRAELERKICYILKTMIGKIVKDAGLDDQVANIKINRGNISVNFDHINLDTTPATRTYQIIDTISRGFSNSQLERNPTLDREFIEFYSNIHSYSVDIKGKYLDYVKPDESRTRGANAPAEISGGTKATVVANAVEMIADIIQEYINFRSYCYETMINTETGTFREGFLFSMWDIYYLCKACSNETIFNTGILELMRTINERLSNCDTTDFATQTYDVPEIGKTIVFATFRNECPPEVVTAITRLKDHILATFPALAQPVLEEDVAAPMEG
jgi:hypothetical protein